jgi:hypothetical protein
MKLQVSLAAGMIRLARMEGNTWEKISRATKKENIMTYVSKFKIKGHSTSI